MFELRKKNMSEKQQLAREKRSEKAAERAKDRSERAAEIAAEKSEEEEIVKHHREQKAADKEQDRFIKSISAQSAEASAIPASEYSKYNVKRGLRNANGTGVIVGLTNIGDVVGYEIGEKGEKIPTEGKLYYRGYDIEDLIAGCREDGRFGFEETAFLLLTGKLPTRDELTSFTSKLSEKRRLPDGFAREMILANPSKSLMNSLARSVLALYSYDSNPDSVAVENVMSQSISLISRFPTLIAYAYQSKVSAFEDRSLHLRFPVPELGTAENLLRMTRSSGEYSRLEAVLLDICLMLHAEHGGGNVSSFTSHLLSSADTDTYSAISAAVGALKGPKHGGANIAVLSMVDDIKANVKDITSEKEVSDYLRKILRGEANDGSGLIYGMGHAIYTLSDPRAKVLKSMAKQLALTDPTIQDDFHLYSMIEKLAPEIFRQEKGTEAPMCANVDLYSGFVYDALGMPRDLATPMFATARVAGWTAHRLEEIIAGKKIIRPAYINIHPHSEYVEISKRQ